LRFLHTHGCNTLDRKHQEKYTSSEFMLYLLFRLKHNSSLLHNTNLQVSGDVDVLTLFVGMMWV
jgi:hypothetical protein